MKSACILFVTALLMGSTDAFMVSPPSSQLRTSLAYASGGALQPPSPSFGSRVIEAVQAPKRTAPTIKARERPPLVEQVMTMEDFKSIVADEKDQIVVVRFYAHWCRACKAMTPSYKKFTRGFEGKNIKFVDCPATAVNVDLHTDLGIESIPFAHVYHPEAGLVEKRKLSRKHYSNFENVVKSYVEGSSLLMEDDCSNPWEEKEVPAVV